MPDGRRPGLWKTLVAAAQTAIDRVADGMEAVADGLRTLARGRAGPSPTDPRLVGVDPAVAAYVTERDPEWFAIEVPSEAERDAGVRRLEVDRGVVQPAPPRVSEGADGRRREAPARVHFPREARVVEDGPEAAAVVAHPPAESSAAPRQGPPTPPSSAEVQVRSVSFRGSEPSAAPARGIHPPSDARRPAVSPAPSIPSRPPVAAAALPAPTSSSARQHAGTETAAASSSLGAPLPSREPEPSEGASRGGAPQARTEGMPVGSGFALQPMPVPLEWPAPAETPAVFARQHPSTETAADSGSLGAPMRSRETVGGQTQPAAPAAAPWPDLPLPRGSEPGEGEGGAVAGSAASGIDVLVAEQRSR